MNPLTLSKKIEAGEANNLSPVNLWDYLSPEIVWNGEIESVAMTADLAGLALPIAPGTLR